MNKINQIVPISEMKLNQPQVLELLRTGPVVLANRSKAAAVLVSIEEWDATAEALEHYRTERRFTQREVEALLAAKEAQLRAGPTVSHDDLKAKMKARAGHVADPV